jgi:hypothetical protein
LPSCEANPTVAPTRTVRPARGTAVVPGGGGGSGTADPATGAAKAAPLAAARDSRRALRAMASIFDAPEITSGE